MFLDELVNHRMLWQMQQKCLAGYFDCKLM